MTYSYSDLALQCRTTTIWTVDVLLALYRCGVKAAMYTAHVGADRRHELKPYYQRSFSADAPRVRLLFQEARHLGIAVVGHALGLPDLIAFITEKSAVVILLVDQNVLRPEGYRTSLESRSFVGHYILLTGFQQDLAGRGVFCYLDPAVPPPTSSGYSMIELRDLDRARMSSGTDQDAIVVDVTQKAKMYSYYGIEHE